MSIEPIIPTGYTAEEYQKELKKEWEEYSKSLPHVPEGKDSKKVYNVVCKSEDDWKYVHEILLQDGTLEDNIPSDKQECINDHELLGILGTYLLNDFEVEELRKHPKVQNVSIDMESYPGSFDTRPITTLDRYSSDVKNYRYHNNGAEFTTNSNAELHRAGYQLLRTTQKTCRWDNQSVATVINDKIEYIGDGNDVDVIVADNAGWFGHPEFNNTTNGGGPQLYTGGNVLPGNGTCDVLDLLLDSPYYLDPEFFDTPNSAGQPGYIAIYAVIDGSPDKTETRWDGTIVPKEVWARRWWSAPQNRSHVDDITMSNGDIIPGGFTSTFPWQGTLISVDSAYTRAMHNGSNSAYPTSPSADHGTQCMSIAYGNTLGHAFNANKWYVDIFTNGATQMHYLTMAKVFHDHKPNRSSDNTKNPTICSNSWGRMAGASAGYYYFRTPGDGTGDVLYDIAITNAYGPEWLKANRSFYYSRSYAKDYSLMIAGKALIDSGVIFVTASGNNRSKQVHSDHPDYNNYVSQNNNRSLEDAWGYGSGVFNCPNRIGYPCQIGQHTDPSTGKEVYPGINVGAIDDNYDGSGTYHPATGKEKLVQYSNKGEAIDVYAPADGSIAAFGLDSTLYTNHNPKYAVPAQYSGLSRTAWQRSFSGTSSACPTVAGLIATKLQSNRSWTYADVKNWINDKCGAQSPDDFYYGEEPTTADSIGWRDYESLMGGTPKLIWDAATATEPVPPNDVYGCTDPNAINYNPNATINDGTCEYAPSDWYVNWSKWTPQTAWVKASEGASGWYLTDPQGWSQFMKDYAMFPSNTEVLADQDHVGIWRFNLIDAGDYTLECQCDGTATFMWDTITILGVITSGPLPTGPHNTSTNYTITVNDPRDYWLKATINNGGSGNNNWNMNPGGVAWVLKNPSGTIVARSSDAFPQTASGAWGSFLNTYGVYSSTTDPLLDIWHETNYVFAHNGGQVIIEGAADNEAQYFIDDVLVGSVSNAATPSIFTIGGGGASANFQNGVPAGNRKFTVKVRNTSVPNNPVTGQPFPNTWSANPGGVAFTIKNSSGTIIKTSLNTGQQPTPTPNTQVSGCTDPNAQNYDPNANVDDGSCTYAPISGCTDPNAVNYDTNATVDDGSCTYGQQGGNNLEQKDVSNTVYFPVMANVKFSQLRNSFRVNTPTGTIKASELRRRTSKTNMDPVVPDSTENTPIATTTNWKVSQFQNSRKYYMIETSSTSTSTIDIPALAWNSNFNKNIRKWYYIKHDCESLNPNQPALRINTEVVNFTLDLQADVHGAGGLRGGEVPSSSAFNWPNSNTNGGPGGNAVQMTPTGNSNNFGVWLRSNSELFAGGGGGGRGELGTAGPDGACYSPRVDTGDFSSGYGEWYSYRRGNQQRTWGCQCEWYIGCGNVADYNNPLTINDPGGYLDGTVYATQTHDTNGDGVGDSHMIGSGTYRSHRSNGGCRCNWIWCSRTCIGDAFCTVDDPVQKPGAPGGNGGYGGLGQGGNQNRETNGRTGDAGTAKNCPTYATVGNTGGTGGAGGNWGQGGTPGGRYWIPQNGYGRTPGLVPGGNWTTIFGPGYTISPVNRVREVLATGVFTFTYLNTDEGTNTTGNTLVSGNRRYSKGSLVVNTGVSKIYQIKVEQSDGGGAGGPAGRAVQGTGYGVAGSTGNIRGGY